MFVLVICTLSVEGGVNRNSHCVWDMVSYGLMMFLRTPLWLIDIVMGGISEIRRIMGDRCEIKAIY